MLKVLYGGGNIIGVKKSFILLVCFEGVVKYK